MNDDEREVIIKVLVITVWVVLISMVMVMSSLGLE
jgi:hypothetical protein